MPNTALGWRHRVVQRTLPADHQRGLCPRFLYLHFESAIGTEIPHTDKPWATLWVPRMVWYARIVRSLLLFIIKESVFYDFYLLIKKFSSSEPPVTWYMPFIFVLLFIMLWLINSTLLINTNDTSLYLKLFTSTVVYSPIIISFIIPYPTHDPTTTVWFK